jgi:undecaprenyl-diphosphatase
MTTLDAAAFRVLNDWFGSSRIVVEVAYFMADYAPMVVISTLVAYFFLETRHRNHVRSTLVVALLAAGLALATSAVLVGAVSRPRPFAVLQGAHLLINSDRHSSFPNVTTAWCTAVAVTVLRVPNRVARGFFVGAALLFGISRPILGDHWPSDILASFVLGWIASQLAFKMAGVLKPVTDQVLRIMNTVDERWLD